ncbi:MAG TPA: glycosyltransferase [Symbiobacteriaceae bacterium]|nr:glycosyltransferase [Symbiobacteriaceae bacterium]
MTTAQWIYVALLALYAFLFLFFLRMFVWKYYADKRYYGQRPKGLSPASIADLAHEKGQDIPGISIFVPARNEADVIEKTIDHLSHLHYSCDHYEILVVTDEKETQAAEQERRQIVEKLTGFLAGEAPWSNDEKADAVLIALLSRLALEEAQLAERKAGPHLSVRELLVLSPFHRQEILSSIAQTLLSDKGRIDRNRLHDQIRRTLPNGDVGRLYPLFLSFAIPTVMAVNQLKKEQGEKLVARLMTEAAQARQPLTQKVLTAMSETVGSRIVRRVQNAEPEKLAEWLEAACIEALPTTQDIVERKRRERAGHRNLPALKHVVVPWDFDGYIDGVCTGQFVPSTKGRALNYAFRFANDRNAVWAFYDAESRPDKETLLYVAWRRLMVGDQFEIAQGPVFQIRNFWKTGPLCKIAGLYQAVSHEWQIPFLLKSIPFIGGTNIFATRNLMLRIGGFDDTVLTEDMELGCRAWLKGNAWPEFLPYVSSEQTPPTMYAFYRQRLRWGSGYLQVWDKIKADNTLPADRQKYLLRTYWWKGHFSWVFFQLIALIPIAVPFLYFNGLLDPLGAPYWVRFAFGSLTPFYIGFTFYCFFHYYKHMDPEPVHKQVWGFTHMLLLPLSAFFLPVPYSSALVLKWMGRQPKGWVKTPRTKE